MLQRIENIARAAGQAAFDIYCRQNFQVQEKSDGSPVTEADLMAHQIIVDRLSRFDPSIPIVSEESYQPGEQVQVAKFWLVDPLDGTKDFVAKTGDFTVKLALIESGKPIAGWVYVPVTKEMFSAWEGRAYRDGQPLRTTAISQPLVAAVSHFHKGEKLSQFLEKNQITSFKSVGSSLKFCRLAEGVIDIYPRLSPTSQWDTAAGQAVAEAAGCQVINIETELPISYGGEEIINPHFIACKPGLSWKT